MSRPKLLDAFMAILRNESSDCVNSDAADVVTSSLDIEALGKIVTKVINYNATIPTRSRSSLPAAHGRSPLRLISTRVSVSLSGKPASRVVGKTSSLFLLPPGLFLRSRTPRRRCQRQRPLSRIVLRSSSLRSVSPMRIGTWLPMSSSSLTLRAMPCSTRGKSTI